MDTYYGEKNCTALYKSGKNKGKSCNNFAYYMDNGNILCGVHSRNIKDRKKLPVNPNKDKLRKANLKERAILVEKAAVKNNNKGKSGHVICSKMRMMKAVDHYDGYKKVFPNFRHQNRKDGFGCKSLSPKSMGPIDHGQPNLPPSKNLENFHQGNKVFPCEVDEDGNPLSSFYDMRIAMYNDSEPHRHKVLGDPKAKSSKGGNKNVPLYSIWRRKNGKEVRKTYLESRQFYCTEYERIALKDENFLSLKIMLKNGYNLQICGYDAYNVDEVPSPEEGHLPSKLEDCYLDVSRPFGHELVLYTLLTVESKDYPWRIHKDEDF